jgi:hypothetical protein
VEPRASRSLAPSSPASSPSSGRVAGLYLAPGAGQTLEELEEAWVIAGQGMAGDRYALGSGHWSSWPDPAGKALTLVAAEVLEETGLSPLEVRRNVVTSGVDLAALVGKTFFLGPVMCHGVRPCLPCHYLETRTRPGLRGLLAGQRGGLRSDVLIGGWLRRGDPVRAHP